VFGWTKFRIFEFMKRFGVLVVFLLFLLVVHVTTVKAQCSICTRTAQQLGERPARALNRGIIYLAFTPLVLFGLIGYRWWKSEQHHE
jgi:Ca2+/Na+ antiporter